jgi:hypothetical protein
MEVKGSEKINTNSLKQRQGSAENVTSDIAVADARRGVRRAYSLACA